MPVAALYDIHGNLPALEAVLYDVRQAHVDGIVIGGDVVPGPMPAETLRCLRSLDIPMQFLAGNGEREVLGARRGEISSAVPAPFHEVLRWSAQQLSLEEVEFISSWPATLRRSIAGVGEVVFCHATPRSDSEIFTVSTAEAKLLPIFESAGARLVVCGHTHMPFDRMIGSTRVVNAGSVGMPFGDPGADWLLLGADVSLRHTAYDLAQAADRVRATAYPQAVDFAARNILHPPSASQMVQLYHRAEIR